MIRTLFTLIKIIIVVAIIVWVAENPGTISIDWLHYKLTFHIGAFLFTLFILVVLGILIFSLIKTVLDWPKTMARYREMTGKEKGLKAVTIGLNAVAAGDSKGASYQAKRAGFFLGENHALAKLLEAQAARLRGEGLEASRAFMALMENKDCSFLGVRGMLQAAIDHGDYNSALEFGNRALKDYPKTGWILAVVYDLEIKARRWDEARHILYRAEKQGVITSEKANSDRVAMLLAQAADAKLEGHEEVMFRSLQKAHRMDPSSIPAVVRLGRMYIERKKHKAAASVIEKTWKEKPHPDLVSVWEEAFRPASDNDPMGRVRWFEKLLSFNPRSVEGLMSLARVLMQEGLWGEARKYLKQAEAIRPNVNLYKLWARLEERATHNHSAARAWLEMAADAPRERVWICNETGRIYEEWVPISDQGLFNTIVWDFPQGRMFEPSLLGHAPPGAKKALIGP